MFNNKILSYSTLGAEEEYEALIEEITNSAEDLNESNENVHSIANSNTANKRSNEVDDDEQDENDEETFNCRLENLGTLCSITRCGAHSTQLASSKATKKFSKQLAEIRSYIKSSNKAENRHLFKDFKPKFKSDNATRWCSSYLMVNSVFIHKEKCKMITDPLFELRSDMWLFIEEFVTVFRPVYEAMQFFQKVQITMGKQK